MNRFMGGLYLWFTVSWIGDLVNVIIVLNRALIENGQHFIIRTIVCYLAALPLLLMIKIFYYDAFDYIFGGNKKCSKSE